MQIGLKVDVQSRGSIDAWLRKVQAATRGPRGADIGLPSGQTPADVAAYAIYNHEGTSRGIPSRPFVRVAFHRNQGAARAALRTALIGAVRGQTTFTASATQIGTLGVKWVQGVIDSNLGPALAASTVRQKGSSRTLIETGKMRAAVSFKVR